MKRVEVRRNGKPLLVAQKVEGFEKIMGIMFQKKFEPLLFEFEFPAKMANSIHSLFCTEFEAVFLDKGKKITEIKTVKPFSFVCPKDDIKFLLELPAGTVKKISLKEGEALNF
jgi:uncharacterized membrane protein (UPF0127 family)